MSARATWRPWRNWWRERPNWSRPATDCSPGRFILVHVICPLIIGGAIYLLWRSPSLKMFTWAENFGVLRPLRRLRAAARSAGMQPPGFIIFNIPDGAWAYSYVAQLSVVWRRDLRKGAGWIAFGPVALLASEFGQRIGLVPGTYDFGDLVSVVAATALAIAATWINFGREYQQQRQT